MLTTTQIGRHYINGRWVEAGGGGTFLSVNPADRSDVIGEFVSGTPQDVDQAVAAAVAAFPKWRARSRIARGELFDRFAQLTQQHLSELAELLAREAGKPLNEARADVVEGIHMAQYVFGTVRMPHGDVVSSEIPEKDLYVRRRPKGVVGVITPWNFPFAVPMWLLGPSLVEG